ncbi:SusD/RagB family nutrient-binding outer membrane lipoprotein [Persicobacter diffluens]|uniref:SusD/RagB family nutrient-binding outer membrane lipoprotein n=1 Tax=Persicobacter diffluens TaxID=981 RepID=A0AAN4VVR1_9BACT|nr:hypothetical protein PEDI_04930 [Persicobacter diffluens]
MTKFKYILGLLAIVLMSSCSEDIMDNINSNPNNPVDSPTNLMLTDVFVKSAFSVTGSDLAFYASSYMEHNVGIYNQLYNAEIRSGEPIAHSTYNNSWNSIYRNLLVLKQVAEKCSDDGNEAGNHWNLGIAQVMTAYNLAILTDLFGDAPWSEALQPGIIFQPKLDKQQDIYQDVFTHLDNAIVNLNKAAEVNEAEAFPYEPIAGQDIFYGGDIDSWIAFANGLKARYTMRLMAQDEVNYQEVVSLVEKSFANETEEARFDYNGGTSISPFYKFFTDRDYFGASLSFYNKLEERNDPRAEVYWLKHPRLKKDTIEFAVNGDPAQAQNRYAVSALSTPTAPTYLLSYHELEFLKAEAYVRSGDLPKAEAALNKAITAAFWSKKYVFGSVADADFASLIQAYITDEVKPLFDADPLSEVMNQKYFAFFEAEVVEAYNDYRRLEAMGDHVIELANEKNATQFPLRFTYGGSDVTANRNVAEAYGDGRYVFSENVWWAKGSR